MASRQNAGPSKAQVDQWNEKAMQLLKRHDQNGDGLLDPREMASAMNELCGTHGFSARSLAASLGIDTKMDNASYRWSPVEFCDLYKRAMLMSDTGADAGGGGGGGRGAERLMGQAVDALRDIDARSEASLKQCYNNYCRLVAAGGGRMMMDGDMKMGSGQWHQLCADVGLAAPVGPVSPSELANIFNTAAQRSSGLTLKQFLTALAMISPDLTTLTNHMVAQLGPQMKPRAGGDAPQPATFPLRNLDLKSQAAQAHWGAAQNVMSAANAFMRAGAAHAANAGGHDGGAVQQRISGGPTAGGGFAVEIEETLTRQRNTGGFASPGQGGPSGLRTPSQSEQLAPLVGGPITAKLGGGGGLKRSSLTSLGGAGGGGGITAGLMRGPGSAGTKSLDSPANQLVLLDRLAAAEARITQLEQQQAFAREMMQAAGQGGGMGMGGRMGGGGGDGGGTGMASPQVAALEAKIAALEAELSRVAPGADAPRLVAEVRDNLDLLTQRVEQLTKSVERATKRIDSAEAGARAAEEAARAVQAPVQECQAGLASLRQVTDGLRSGVVSKETELMTTLVQRISGTEGAVEALEGQLRKLQRDGKVQEALPSKEALMAVQTALVNSANTTNGAGGGGGGGGGGGDGEGVVAVAAPSTPTPGGGSGGGKVPLGKEGGGGGGGGGNANGDYFVQTLGAVQLDSEEDIRLQIKLLCEAMDNVKRRVNQIAGSTHLNPIDFPTRNELNEVKKVLLTDLSDIDAKYIKLQKEVGSLSLKMPALEKKVESSSLASGTEVVNRLVSMGMARLADVKDTENYLVDRGQGVTKQFDNLKREMQDVQGDLQSNMDKLVTQFNAINKKLMDAKRDASAPGVALVAAAVGVGGGGGAASAATAATAASAAATAAQTAAEARSAIERERQDRERETRDLRERLARAESHLGGALGELQTVVGAELSSVKEVLAQLEAAMNQADGDLLRMFRELEAGLKGAQGALERASNESSEMTGKVIMKMARQITEMQVKLRELATSAAASPQPSPQQHMQQQQQQQQQHYAPQQQQQRDSRGPQHSDRDEPMPFAARLLAQQQASSGGGGGGSGSGGGYPDHGGGGGGGSPSSPSHGARRDYQPRVSSSGAGPGLLSRAAQDRPVTPLTAENLAALNSAVAGARGGAGQSPARGMLAADPPPLPAARNARLSDLGGHRASNNGRG